MIEYGVIFNHKKIARIMKKYSLKPEYIKRIRNSGGYKKIQENVRPNLVKRNFNTEKKNQIWCTDVTYLTFGNKRAYLSTIIDLYDRRVVAYKISRFNNLQFVIETLNEAIQKEGNIKDLILHSDQGSQYTSNQYKEICLANGIQISMSRKGTPITLYNNQIKSLDEYIHLVEDWIIFYNTKRLKNRKPKPPIN